MPKLTQEVTAERDAELAARALKARGRLPAPKTTETTHATEARALAAAKRLGLPNTAASAVQTTHGWVGVVQLRGDQEWMVPIITNHGCRVARGPNRE